MRTALTMVILAVLTGCASYTWRSTVPEDMRTISVPTFRNESDVTELGAITAKQLLREVQREGTFKIKSVDESMVEIQGIVKGLSFGNSVANYKTGSRYYINQATLTVVISVIDHKNGRVMINNKTYTASVPLASGQDLMTAKRDVSGRVADVLAREVIDEITALKWN